MSIRNRAMQGIGAARGTVTTTSATVTDLNPNGGVLALKNSSAIGVIAEVVGRRTDTGTEAAFYVLRAGVTRGANAAATALVGSVDKTVIGETTAEWDATLAADTTAGGVKVRVTGEAAKTIKWTAQFRYVESA